MIFPLFHSFASLSDADSRQTEFKRPVEELVESPRRRNLSRRSNRPPEQREGLRQIGLRGDQPLGLDSENQLLGKLQQRCPAAFVEQHAGTVNTGEFGAEGRRRFGQQLVDAAGRAPQGFKSVNRAGPGPYGAQTGHAGAADARGRQETFAREICVKSPLRNVKRLGQGLHDRPRDSVSGKGIGCSVDDLLFRVIIHADIFSDDFIAKIGVGIGNPFVLYGIVFVEMKPSMKKTTVQAVMETIDVRLKPFSKYQNCGTVHPKIPDGISVSKSTRPWTSKRLF